MNTIRGFGNYQYGEVGALVTTSGQTAPYSGQVQSLFNVGVTVSVPLDVIYDRKNNIKKQQARVDRAEKDVQQALEELKITISETYVTAVQQLNTLKVRIESLWLANSDIKMSENGYLNGNLELSDLNYRKTIQASAQTNYEATKADLNKAILRLELMTNIKILKKQ
jgi:outer membrane protein TolC